MPANWYLATHPDSYFRQHLTADRPDEGLRYALRDATFHTHVTGGETETRVLQSAGELREVLSGPIGIALPASDKLDAVLERALAAGR